MALDLDALALEGDQEHAEELGNSHKARTTAERNARNLDDAVRRVGQREQARRPGHDPTVRVRQLEPTVAEPDDNTDCAGCGHVFLIGEGHWRDPSRHNLLVHTKGGCDRARSRAAAVRAPQPEEASVDTATQADGSPGVPPSAGEDVNVTLSRRIQIFEWLLAEGPQTIADIQAHFEISNATARSDIEQLRVEGRLERAGVERSGPRGGRSSVEFRAFDSLRARPADAEPSVPDELLGAAGEVVDRDGEEKSIAERIAERRDAGLTIDPTPFPDRLDATERTREIGEQVCRELEACYSVAPETEPEITNRESRITVHEQLVVRYVSSLISTIDRASVLRAEAPPEHVFDRIERLLQIEGGVR